jgi:hypothetical protein
VTLAEGSFESNVHVTDNINRTGKNFGEAAAEDRGKFGTSGAGATDAGVRDLRGHNSGAGASLTHALVERLAGPRFADTDDVAGTGGSRGEKAGFIAHRAGRFGTTAVNAKVVGHGLVLTQQACRRSDKGHVLKTAKMHSLRMRNNFIIEASD